jgi:hypothetical protein
MKTRTNITRSIKKGLLSIVLTSFISAGVFAQTSQPTFTIKDILSPKAEVKAESTGPSMVATVEVDFYAKSLDFVVEEEMEVENWMTDDSAWGENTAEKGAAEENELTVEDWMTDVSSFANATTENTVKLEAWMKTSGSWSCN